MSYEYDIIDGVRVERHHVAPAFRAMATDFYKETGCTLHIRSPYGGTRTRAQQQYLYDGYIKGLPGFNLAAHPDSPLANHLETSAIGPTALDLYDSGKDAGVTVIGSKRSNILVRLAKKHGFTNAGHRFKPAEGWHYEYTGSLAGKAGAMNAASKQSFLDSLGYSTGAPGWGAKCEAATKDFQKKVGLTADGIFGPNTEKVAKIIIGGGNYTKRPVKDIQTRLKALGFNPGTIDGQWGNKTSLATYLFQKANKLTADAQYGDMTDKKAFPPAPPKPAPKPEAPVGRNDTDRKNSDIQKFLKTKGYDVGDIDGEYGPKMTAAVTAFQKDERLVADGIWGFTTDGIAFPPAGSIKGVDYSFARPSVESLVAAGVKHVGRYLWNEKYEDGRTNKGLSRAEYDRLTTAGIKVWLIYEEDGKELVGFDAGVRVAKAAEAHRERLGLPEQPIYFNVDYNASAEHMPAILDSLRGIASVIGLERTGLYAGYGPLKAAFDAGVITWGFQTYAWSGGKWDDRAHLQQWSNSQWGGTVDFTRAVKPEYGQNPVAAPEPEVPSEPEPTPEVGPDFVSVPRVWIEDIIEQLQEILA